VSDRAQLLKEGYHPVVPLENGVDLWANDDYVCAFIQGHAIVVMLRSEYDDKRWALLQKACRESILQNPRKGNL